MPIVVGGPAILNPDVANMLDADGWAPDGRGAVQTIADLTDQHQATKSASASISFDQIPPTV